MGVRINWQELEPKIVQVDKTVINKRQSMFAVSCPICQHERLVTYCSVYNIAINKHNGCCQSCTAKKLGFKPPIFKKGQRRKKHNTKNKGTFYSNLFNNAANNPKTKIKMSLAKIGKTGELSNRWDGGLTAKRINNRKIKRRAYIKNRMKNDPVFRAMKIIRDRTARLLKDNNMKVYSSKIGCNAETLRLHLESKFQSGMTWENHGLHGWHIDHIYPLSRAIRQGTEAFLKACHYTNLQPLWAADNNKKRAKVIEGDLSA